MPGTGEFEGNSQPIVKIGRSIDTENAIREKNGVQNLSSLSIIRMQLKDDRLNGP
jgi:hypothetical protein